MQYSIFLKCRSIKNVLTTLTNVQNNSKNENKNQFHRYSCRHLDLCRNSKKNKKTTNNLKTGPMKEDSMYCNNNVNKSQMR